MTAAQLLQGCLVLEGPSETLTELGTSLEQTSKAVRLLYEVDLARPFSGDLAADLNARLRWFPAAAVEDDGLRWKRALRCLVYEWTCRALVIQSNLRVHLRRNSVVWTVERETLNDGCLRWLMRAAKPRLRWRFRSGRLQCLLQKLA